MTHPRDDEWTRKYAKPNPPVKAKFTAEERQFAYGRESQLDRDLAWSLPPVDDGVKDVVDRFLHPEKYRVTISDPDEYPDL